MKRALFLLTILTTLIIATASIMPALNGLLDLNQLENYANQNIPGYINEDNTPENNEINDAEATLGRVLFYDKQLSVNNTISCASCHQQQFAFSDTATQSIGLYGELTGRHSMRLINARFAEEDNFFWDERANSLEDQTTQPIQDHIEMGFSGTNGDPDLDDLLNKLQQLEYYNQLFEFVYNDSNITEERLQRALAQFVRSIQSFDSKYDIGRAQVNGNNQSFPNFTAAENRGKTLFMSNQQQGGANCQTCHRAPEFDIAPNRRNNGVIGVAGNPNAQDLNNTRSPTLRDLINPNGVLNGPMMHDGSLTSLRAVIDHYNAIPANNTNLDNRLRDGNQAQRLNLSEQDKTDLEAFLRTLTGNDVYTNPKWSNPFSEDGSLSIITGCDNIAAPSIIDLPVVVNNSDPISLIGSPEGGVFSGAGITFSTFNPSVLQPGTYDITYTITNAEGCSAQTTETVLVTSIVYNFVNYNLGTLSPKIMLDVEVSEGSHQPVIVNNLNGSVVYTTNQWFDKGRQQFSIDTYGWAKGVYFIKIGQLTKAEKVYIY